VRNVAESLRGQTVRTLTEIRGERRWYSTTIEPIVEPDGKSQTALVIARDIHNMEQAEMQLAQLRQRMTKAERLASIGTIGAALSHRVTQPLTAIALSIENALAELETTEVPASISKCLRRGLDGVTQISSIADNLRNLAKAPGKSAAELIDLGLLVGEVFKILRQEALTANVSLSMSDLDVLPPVFANRFAIEQAFFALVQNAIQAADRVQTHKITVSGSSTDDQVELRFADDCGGIARENYDRIFEPFFTTKEFAEGTGLGLCIAEQMIDQAGGRIRLENCEGQGSTFIVTLRRNREENRRVERGNEQK